MRKWELEDLLETQKQLLRQQSDTITRLWESVDNQRSRLILINQELENLKAEERKLRLRLNFYRRQKLKDKTAEAEIEKAFYDFSKDKRTDN